VSAGPQLVADRYRLDERIGAGGMGVVWRAHDLVLGRTVAVKQLVLGPELSPSDAAESRARAMREGRIAARLQHPNAINVFDVALGPDAEGDGADQPWLVMEYLPSRTLDELLAREGPLPPAEVARIGRDIAAALAAAHAAGIVHRDVKPGNVLIGDNGTVKITDFGISRASWDVTVTRTGVVAGTPAYFAPEVARGEAPDPASDVFSLGSTLFTAVEGAPPFGQEDNQLALLRAVADGVVRPPRNAGGLSSLLMQLLEREPADRPGMAQARDRLGEIAETEREPLTTAALPAASAADLDLDTNIAASSQVAPSAAVHRAAGGARSTPLASAAQSAPSAQAPPAQPAPPARSASSAQSARSAPSAPAIPQPDRSRPWWRRRTAIAGAIALLLIVFASVVLVTVLTGNEDPQTATASPNSSTADTSTTSSSPSTTAASTSADPSTTTPTAPAQPGPAEFVQAVQTYYGLLPDQLDEAYAYLGPGVQDQAGGRAGYENFWSDYAEVEAENVQAAGTTVTLTIVYTRPDGSTFPEPYTLEMGTAEDGRILILTSAIGGPG